jgi:NAD(P) transhydrogenase
MREARQFRDQQHSGFLSEAVSRKQAVIDRHERLLLNQLMSHGVSLLPGEAGFIDAHTLSLRKSNGEVAQLSAAVIVLATGSRPRRPADVPFDKERVLDSTSILQMRRLPQRMTIIGGGVIACEFTTMFAPLGVAVSLIDTHDHLLAYLDADIQQTLEHDLLDMGVQLHMKTRVKRIERHDQRVQLETDSGVIFETDVVLYALGRVPNYDSLKLDAAGIDADDQGWVRINEHHQTSQDHIYIIGDLAGRPSLASTAMEQGRLAMKHAFDRKHAAPAGQLPMAIYTIPELSYVGNTERELQEQGIDYVVGRARFSETARGQIIGEERGFMKLLVDRSSQALLGVHIIGESASELVHIGQMAMNCGAGVNLLASTVYNYPTLAHCYKSAALHCLQQLQA